MTPTYLNSSPSPYPLILGEDHHDHHVYNPQAASSSSSPPPPPPPPPLSQVLTYSFQDHLGVSNYPREVLNYQEGNYMAPKGESDHGGGMKFWISTKEDESKDQTDHKWMPPKLRLIRRMKDASDQARIEAAAMAINPQVTVKLEDEKQASSSIEIDGGSKSSLETDVSNNNNTSPIRVCSDCHTTKTPLWRSGPRGPKSLCNACGIRQRKARRALAAAAAAAVSGGDHPADTSPAIKAKVVHHKKKRSNTNVNDHNAQNFKRRPKFQATSTSTTTIVQSQVKKRLSFEDFLMSLNKSLEIHQVFPQDEKEAAILLMALSCHDLVHG